MELAALTSWHRTRAAGHALLAGAAGGLYLYMLNTLPDLSAPFFGSMDGGGVFWKMQFCIFLSYMLLACVMLGATAVLDHLLVRFPRVSLPWRIVLCAVAIYLCSAIALVAVVKPFFFRLFDKEWIVAWPMWFMAGVSGTVVYACVQMMRARDAHRRMQLRLRIESEELDAALDRAELSMLEAQIEPHFLFNTLAHVKRQYRVDAARADSMLASLIDYLERAMPALRRIDWTVEDELDLIRNYLEILEERFGARLRFQIHSDPATRSVLLPALVVATLVENSVRHGLAPKEDGGLVSIDVALRGGRLHLEVCDDGVGFRKTSGSGLGLATVRARLKGTFGHRAQLLVEPMSPAGVRALISIRLEEKG